MKCLIDMTNAELRQEKSRLENGGEVPHDAEDSAGRIKTIDWILEERIKENFDIIEEAEQEVERLKDVGWTQSDFANALKKELES